MSAMALPLMAVSSLSQYSQTKSAGKISQIESEVAAKQEELAAVQREADRKASLARAMASQTASAGARSIAAFEGSPLAVLEEDQRLEAEATQRDVFSTRLAAMSERARGTVSKNLAYGSANVGLLTDTAKMASVAPSWDTIKSTFASFTK